MSVPNETESCTGQTTLTALEAKRLRQIFLQLSHATKLDWSRLRRDRAYFEAFKRDIDRLSMEGFGIVVDAIWAELEIETTEHNYNGKGYWDHGHETQDVRKESQGDHHGQTSRDPGTSQVG